MQLHTCPRIVQGPPSGTRHTRINSASFTILSARKCFKYSTNCSADVICDRDDTVKGVDKPVPRCQTKAPLIFNKQRYTQMEISIELFQLQKSCLIQQNDTIFFTCFLQPSARFGWPWALKTWPSLQVQQIWKWLLFLPNCNKPASLAQRNQAKKTQKQCKLDHVVVLTKKFYKIINNRSSDYQKRARNLFRDGNLITR